MQRLLLTVLALATGVACRADEATDLVEVLFAGNAEGVSVAGTKLLALGTRAREALERRVDPVGASERAAPPSAEEQEELDTLVDQLAVGPFAVREQATLDLIAKGLPAIRALRATVRGASPEPKARTTRIIESILGPPAKTGPLGSFHLVQAALLLGWIGDPAAISSLRHVLDTGAPEVAAAADVALRLIRKSGPAVAPLVWRADAAAARAAWRDHLALPAAPAAAAELVLAPIAAGGARHVFAKSHQELRLDGAMAEEEFKEMCWRMEATESFVSNLRAADAFVDDRRYEAHHFVYAARQSPDACEDGFELGGDPLTFALGEDGRLAVEPLLLLPTEDLLERSMGRILQPLYTPGLLLRSVLPTGVLRAGATIEIAPPGLARLAALMTIYGQSSALAGSRGRVHYLGRRDAVDRLHVGIEWTFVGEEPRPTGVVLTGVLEADARTGEILAYDLSGPLWVPGHSQDEEPRRPAWFLGEQRFFVVACDHERHTAGTPGLDAFLATLANPSLARRVVALQGLRAAGEAARPAIERILHPDVDASVDAQDDLRRIDVVLAARDEGERLRAFAAMLRRGARSVRGALTARLERATAAEVETLAPLLRWVSPPEHATVEAALLLAAIGTDASVGKLRSALAAGTPSVAAAADFALRAIVGEGPDVAANPLALNRAGLVAAWDAHLAARAAWSGPVATLAPRIAPEVELDARLRCRIALRVSTGVAPGEPGAAPGAPEDALLTSDAEGRFRRVAGDAPVIVGRLLSYRERLEHIPTKPLVIENKDIEIAESAPGVFALRAGGRPLSRTNPAVLPLSLFWAELLPAGAYEVGAARPVGVELVDRLRASFVLPATFADRMTDHAGRLRYLGRRDGRDRYALAVQLVVEVEAEKVEDRSALAGVIEVDPERGLVLKLALSGPGWGRVGGNPTLGWTEITEASAPTR